MVDDGLEFTANEVVLNTKLNRKTLFVGRGTQINSITTTYPGKLAFSTLTENNFNFNKLYLRNAANTTWTANLTETAEQSSTPAAVGSNQTPGAGFKYYYAITLPTSEKWYLITGIEWKNGSSVAGNTICGVDRIDADPPVLASTPLLALGREMATSGTNQVQRNSNISSQLIRGGTLVGGWVMWDTTGSSTQQVLTSQPAQNVCKSETYSATPKFSSNVAWSAANQTIRPHIKLYYRGYI